MEIDVSALLKRAMSGDAKASLEIVKLQREGRALRLYPHGRKGPLDEGVTPVVFGRNSETGLLMIERAKTGAIEFKYKDVAFFMMNQVHLCGLLFMDYCEQEDPFWEIESLADCDLKHMTWITDDSIKLQFIPDSPTIEYGIAMTQRIMTNWMVLIEQSDLDYSVFGFEDDEDYLEVVDFCDVGKWCKDDY